MWHSDARAHRAVLGRVVGYLAQDAGIRQLPDTGTGVAMSSASAAADPAARSTARTMVRRGGLAAGGADGSGSA
jgi:hypothetical protein